jgi:lambda family phage portal protein
MNGFERFIEFISPQTALERERARKHVQLLRGFDAAKKGRRTSSWRATGTSQNAEIYRAASILRDRSRELCRNNPYVKRAVQSIANNVVGTGIRAKVTGQSKKRIHAEWIAWADKTECDFQERMNLYGIQKLVMRTMIESGDALIIRRRNRSKRIPIELQVVEIDYLDSTKHSNIITEGGEYDFMGIRYNQRGKRVGYWLFDHHPNDVITIGRAVSKLVPAEDVIHVYEVLRPSQQLGVPFGVSAFLRVRDMDEYNDAQVVRQKIAACYTVNITSNGGADTIADTQTKREELERIEPGMINVLNAGESIEFGTPPTVENFGEFSRVIMQGVAAGFGTTYENLTGDLSNVNFSSGRMGWIEHHRNIEDWQWNVLIPQLCDRISVWFLDAAELAFGKSGNVTFEWTPPRREMIDPVKEVKGITAMVRGGLMSLTEAIREQGYDPEQVFDEIEATNKLLDEKEIILDTDPRKGKNMEDDERGRPTDTGEGGDDDVDRK